MKVPFLTMPGTRFASRVGASLLQALDNPFLYSSLVVENWSEYKQQAISIATNSTLANALKVSVSC
jgi:predicted O-linked N-acetylglucosamine transferase (SPINDLY family)